MAKKDNRPLKKITVRVYEDDYTYIQSMLPNTSGNKIIRQVLNGFVNKMKADTAEQRREDETTERPTL